VRRNQKTRWRSRRRANTISLILSFLSFIESFLSLARVMYTVECRAFSLYSPGHEASTEGCPWLGNAGLISDYRTECIHFRNQQNGGAGCIHFHSQQYGRAGCLPFQHGRVSISTARIMDVQGYPFPANSVWKYRCVSLSTANRMDVQGVTIFTAAGVWTWCARCMPFPTASSMDEQGVSPLHRQQNERAGCVPASSMNVKGVPLF
jgi:hypothetical protein